MQEMRSKLEYIVGNENVLTGEPMAKHTTFRVGGPADYFVTPETEAQLRDVMRVCREEQVPYFVMGNGSNLLVSDEGYRGIIIQLYDKFNKIEYFQNSSADMSQCGPTGAKADGAETETHYCVVKAQAGVMLGKLGNELAKKGVTGFEFATGIPGTVGGAVRMNAGAYGGEMKDILACATVMDENGLFSEMTTEELELGYRTSNIVKNKYTVVAATFRLAYGDKETVQKTIADLAGKRREKQPLEYPSAGSTFKRPEGHFAGQLIQEAGMKGYSVGGAQVSEKHAGFVINKGNATAADIIRLTDDVKMKVKEMSGVELELEVRKLGF